jgi:cell division septation protein DedD
MSRPLWDEDQEDKVINLSWRSPWVMLGISILSGILGISILYYLFTSPAPDAPEEIPIIQVEPTPFKVKPANPGGYEVPHQDKTVYENIIVENIAEGNSTLAPAAEEPIATFSSPDQPSYQMAPSGFAVPLNHKVEVEDIGVTGSPSDLTINERIVIQEAPQKASMPQPVKEPAAPALEAPALPPVPKPVSALTEGYKVQLASLSTKALAEKEWVILKRKHKDLLKDLSFSVVKADVKGKGTFYRVQAGPLPSKEEAARFCKKLTSQGAACMLVS